MHISENFPPPWKWLLEYFISRLSFRTQVDIHVSSHQSFIHKTLCSAEQFRDNMGNQKSKGLWPICIFHSNIWSVLFKSHLLILLWELSENFISFLSLWLYYFKNFKLNETGALYSERQTPLVATHLSIFISFNSLREKNLKSRIAGNAFYMCVSQPERFMATFAVVHFPLIKVKQSNKLLICCRQAESCYEIKHKVCI